MRFLILFLAAISVSCFSQEGYQIDFKIKGFKDSTIFLCYYYWESTFSTDTAKASTTGEFTFTGTKSLPHGVYFLLTKTKTGNVKQFDFLVGQDQRFSMATNAEDYIGHMKVSGDVDNTLFFGDMIHNMERGKEAEPYRKILLDSLISEANKKEAREAFNKVGKKVMGYHDGLIKKYPTSLTARILKAHKAIEIPDAPRLANGRVDSSFQFRYYKAHYWDNFDLSDEALLRLSRPLYLEKVKYYLNNLVVPRSDSLSKEIDRLAAKARKNKETYKYLVWKCMSEYADSKIMGLDAIYVHLYDQYFATREMDYWLNEKTKKNIKDHADQLRRSLIGQTAPNLIMQDQNLQPRNMYDLNKRYTILFIFDPDCPTCRAETPELISFYQAHKKKFDLEVFAVCMDSSMKTMKKFISEMNTPWITVNGPRSYVGSIGNLYDAAQVPSLYIIDNKKKIIAKKPPIDKIHDFLTHHEKTSKK